MKITWGTAPVSAVAAWHDHGAGLESSSLPSARATIDQLKNLTNAELRNIALRGGEIALYPE